MFVFGHSKVSASFMLLNFAKSDIKDISLSERDNCFWSFQCHPVHLSCGNNIRNSWLLTPNWAQSLCCRRFKGPYPFSDYQRAKEQATDDEENDNWELPAGELPSYSYR
jgi:hypothetical protein